MPHPFSHTLTSIEPTEFKAHATEFTDELLEGVTQFINNSVRHLTRDNAIPREQYENYYKLFVDWNSKPLYSLIDKAIGGNLPRLPKRVSSVVYKATGIKLPKEILAKVGEMAAQEDMPVRIADTVHEITWRVGDYGDWNRGDHSNPSCFFGGCYNYARVKTLPALHRGAIRFYREDKRTGYGRCWYIPLPDDHPSFDPENPVYVVCNYYGDTPVVFSEVARLLLEKQYGQRVHKAVMLREHRRLLRQRTYTVPTHAYRVYAQEERLLHERQVGRPPVPVNKQDHFRRGYQFKPKWARHPSPADEPYEEDEEDEPYATCTTCGCSLDENEVWTNRHADNYCNNCYHERYGTCALCDNEYLRVDGHRVSGLRVCDYCYDHYVEECPSCHNEVFVAAPPYRDCYRENMYTDPNTGERVCYDCGQTRQMQATIMGTAEMTTIRERYPERDSWRTMYLRSHPRHFVVINEDGDVTVFNEQMRSIVSFPASAFGPVPF